VRTSNPALKEGVWRRPDALAAGEPMTIAGTATKSLALVLLTIFAAGFTWTAVQGGNTGIVTPAMLVGGLGGFVVAMVTIFRPRFAPVTAPLYAVLEGLLLGAVSALYQARYAGLPAMAVGLTTLTFLAMLFLYRTRIVRVTERFRFAITAAMGGILLFYLASFVLGFFGVRLPLIHDAGPFGIAFSAIVVGVAAFSLLLDFDMIEQGVAARAPRYMEWYGAFSVLVGLVWLYLEMLRLLSKLQRR
jgi:uncharacterized YccA/Bax inhibitor family protein